MSEMLENEYVKHDVEVLKTEQLACGIPFRRVHDHVTVRLKNCPHCGGPGVTLTENDDEEGRDFERVRCQKCEIETALYETLEEAVMAWNKRIGLQKNRDTRQPATCAFCGSKATLEWGEPYTEHENDYRVECRKCGAATQYYQKSGDALQRWNRRV